MTQTAKRAGPVTEPATWITEMLDADPAFGPRWIRSGPAGDRRQVGRTPQGAEGLPGEARKNAGVSQSAIAQLETGTATNYELRTLARYATALGAVVEVKIRRRTRTE